MRNIYNIYSICIKWLPEGSPNYPKHSLRAAKRPPKGMLPSLASFRQPFCMYGIYFVFISYVFCYILVYLLYSDPPRANPPYWALLKCCRACSVEKQTKLHTKRAMALQIPIAIAGFPTCTRHWWKARAHRTTHILTLSHVPEKARLLTWATAQIICPSGVSQ